MGCDPGDLQEAVMYSIDTERQRTLSCLVLSLGVVFLFFICVFCTSVPLCTTPPRSRKSLYLPCFSSSWLTAWLSVTWRICLQGEQEKLLLEHLLHFNPWLKWNAYFLSSFLLAGYKFLEDEYRPRDPSSFMRPWRQCAPSDLYRSCCW